MSGRQAVSNRASIAHTQNLTLQSEDLSSGAAWVLSSVSITADAGVAPAELGGGMTADLVTASAGVATHAVDSTVIEAWTSGSWHCCSAYLKASTNNFGAVMLDYFSTGAIFSINLTTGAEVLFAAASVYESRRLATNKGNGWWLLEMAIKVAVDNTGVRTCIVGVANAAGAINFNAAGTESILATGTSASRANQPGTYGKTTAAVIDTGPLRNLRT